MVAYARRQAIRLDSVEKQVFSKNLTTNDIQPVLDYFAQTYPEDICFLEYTTPYSLLVAVVLSAQSTDRMVNACMPPLLENADTPEKMIALGASWLIPHISRIGLYQRKSAYIIQLSHQLLDLHNGHVPDTIEDLMALQGVGRKTANVVLNVIFGHPTIAVDTHVERVSKRLGWVDNQANPLRVEQALNDLVPMPWKSSIHTWLIMHGRMVCQRRAPKCGLCPVKKTCLFFSKK